MQTVQECGQYCSKLKSFYMFSNNLIVAWLFQFLSFFSTTFDHTIVAMHNIQLQLPSFQKICLTSSKCKQSQYIIKMYIKCQANDSKTLIRESTRSQQFKFRRNLMKKLAFNIASRRTSDDWTCGRNKRTNAMTHVIEVCPESRPQVSRELNKQSKLTFHYCFSQ